VKRFQWQVSGTVVPFHDTVKLLGVTLDSALTLRQVLRCCSYHTCALRHIRPLLTFYAAKTISRSIVSSWLDYNANALLHGISASNLGRLQVAHSLTIVGRCARLHALPVLPSYIGCQFANASSPTRQVSLPDPIEYIEEVPKLKKNRQPEP